MQSKLPKPGIPVPCPICAKRAFDISELPSKPLKVTLKCPHCHRIVPIRCGGYMELAAEEKTEYLVHPA